MGNAFLYFVSESKREKNNWRTRQILKAPNIDTSLALNYTYIYSHVPRNDPVSL